MEQVAKGRFLLTTGDNGTSQILFFFLLFRRVSALSAVDTKGYFHFFKTYVSFLNFKVNEEQRVLTLLEQTLMDRCKQCSLCGEVLPLNSKNVASL